MRGLAQGPKPRACTRQAHPILRRGLLSGVAGPALVPWHRPVYTLEGCLVELGGVRLSCCPQRGACRWRSRGPESHRFWS